jgi:hypothetical protein
MNWSPLRRIYYQESMWNMEIVEILSWNKLRSASGLWAVQQWLSNSRHWCYVKMAVVLWRAQLDLLVYVEKIFDNARFVHWNYLWGNYGSGDQSLLQNTTLPTRWRTSETCWQDGPKVSSSLFLRQCAVKQNVANEYCLNYGCVKALLSTSR